MEPEGHRENETPQEVLNEILTGQPAHQEESEESEEEHLEEESLEVEKEISEGVEHK